jgi:hypothetical protein
VTGGGEIVARILAVGSNGSNVKIQTGTGTATLELIQASQEWNAQLAVDNHFYLTNVTSSRSPFIVENTAKGAALVLTGSGVGIGTTSPAEKLTVGDDTNEAHITSTGDLYFTGTAGMVYAGISATDNTTETAISVAGTLVQVTIFDTNNPSNLCTPDHTNDHITITKAGDYMVVVSATVESVAGGAIVIDLQAKKNNGATALSPVHAHRNMAGGGGDVGSISLSGIVTLAASDTVELWIANDTATGNLIVEDVVLSVIQVGG